MNIKDKLRQLDRASSSMRPLLRMEAASNLAEALGGEEIHNDLGRFVLTRHRVHLSQRHGAIELGHLHTLQNRALRIAAKNRISANFDLRKAIFLDTETTGLAGGTGTYIFLLGIGYVQGEHFVVDQLFLPTLANEPALLSYLDTLIEDRRYLVTFNGKSYDVPLMTTRFIRHRLPCRLDLLEHLDLLHAARRLWKDDFGNCSLGTLEKALLGVARDGDVPGAEIPQIYFDFLRFGRTEPLRPVLYHNRMDIISLLALAIGVAEKLELGEDAQINAAEAERMVKLYASSDAYSQAETLLVKLLEQEQIPEAKHVDYLLDFARTQKRLQQHDRALAALLEATSKSHFTLEAFVELAKYLEHREKDYAKALHYTERALASLTIRAQLQPERSLFENQQKLLHRQSRLLRKIGRTSS